MAGLLTSGNEVLHCGVGLPTAKETGREDGGMERYVVFGHELEVLNGRDITVR